MTEYQLRRIGVPPSHPEVANCLRIKNHNNARTTFGRDTSQSHYIDSTQYERLISRRQAEITCIENENGALQFVLKDMSLNGTYVNDVRVNGECILNSGDSVTFGHIQGVKISPGQYAPQNDSEFKFVFEEVTEDNQSLEPEIVYHTLDTVCTDVTDCTEADYIPPDSTTNDTSTNYVALQPYHGDSGIEDANSRGQERLSMGSPDADDLGAHEEVGSEEEQDKSDSEEDIFTAKTKTNKKGGKKKDTPKTTKASKAKEKETPKLTGSAKRKKGSRQQNTGKKKQKLNVPTNQDQDDTWYWHDDSNKCAAYDCERPGNNEKVEWVQCDDCDEWYHTQCAGCKYSLVKKSNTEFHCGCT